MCNENIEQTASIAVQEQNNNVPHKWTEEEINTIRNTVAKDASPSELKMFLHLASAYGLDPFAHEIWFVKMGGQNVIITARDGYLKIAQNNPHFRGMEADVIYSGDKFRKDKDGVTHEYTLANRGHIVGAYATVYRDDRDKPAYFFAPFDNYKRGGVWQQYPHAMIIKVAEGMALKRAFAINGLVTQEEVGYDGDKKILSVNEQEEEARKKEMRKKTLLKIWNLYITVCGNKPHAQNAMKKITGKDKTEDYTDDDINALFEDLKRRFAEKQAQQQQTENEQKQSAEVQVEEQETTPETIDVDFNEEAQS